MTDKQHCLTILREVTTIPTAPFHEESVGRYVTSFLRALGLAPWRDDFGNILVRYSHGSASRPIALVAHMDHPAFEVAAVEEGKVTAQLLGGVAARCFRQPVPVRVYRPSGEEVAGTVVGYVERGRRDVSLDLAMEGTVAAGDFGVFDLTAYREEGDVVYLRAADDLASCATILLTLEELARRQVEADVFGVFTRAEEVGLIGATLLAEAGTLPRDTVVVSLETSKELPGALMGQGPVIRVGDLTRSFDPEAEALLLAARARLQAADPEARVQRQLMAGGTCEATAFVYRGYCSGAVAIPLGNYHNVGPDDTVSPEFVSASDFAGEVDLLVAAAEIVDEPTDHLWARFAESAAKHRDRMLATADRFGEPG